MAAPSPAGRSRLTLTLLLLTTVSLLTLDLRSFGPLETIQGGIRTVLDPFGDAIGAVFGPIGNGWEGFTEYDDVVAQNEALRAELDELRGGAVRGQAAEATLEQLLTELDIEYLAGVQTVTGRVGDRIGNFDNFAIDIDKGSNNGVAVGMPAVTAAGLVGRVKSVSPDQSRIELITESNFGVGVRIIGTGDLALARGQGRGNDLVIPEGVDDNSEVTVGMAVVTSGIEGSPYPPDIGVGVVSALNIDSAELNQEVSITPLADLDGLAFITVILWTLDN